VELELIGMVLLRRYSGYLLVTYYNRLQINYNSYPRVFIGTEMIPEASGFVIILELGRIATYMIDNRF